PGGGLRHRLHDRRRAFRQGGRGPGRGRGAGWRADRHGSGADPRSLPGPGGGAPAQVPGRRPVPVGRPGRFPGRACVRGHAGRLRPRLARRPASAGGLRRRLRLSRRGGCRAAWNRPLRGRIAMAATLGWFALGLLMLALGGDSTVKGVSGLAQRLGLRPFTAGVLLLAFATSLPELVVNLRAVWIGQPYLALGNAMGSTIANLGLSLGVAALVAPLLLRARLLLLQLLAVVLAAVVMVGLGLDGRIGRVDGLVLVAGFVAVLAFVLRRGAAEAPDVRE